MNSYYDSIMNLLGADDVKGLIRKWELLSGNMKNNPTRVPIILPDMLWVGRSGVGRTKILNLMAEYLNSKENLIDFYGEVKFFEFRLNYVPKDQPFTELTRLVGEVGVAAGFRNEYRGIIHIEIDEWKHHFEEQHFVSFMEYLTANSDMWMIILSIPEWEEENVHNLEAFLSMYLRLEKVVLKLPETQELFSYIEMKFAEYGLSLDQDGRELLIRSVDVLRKNRHFDGFKTIKRFCQDIVYDHFCKSDPSQAVVSREELQAFSEDSEYIARTVATMKMKRQIGFRTEE